MSEGSLMYTPAMLRLLAICLGGAVGTAGRYLLATWLPTVAGTAFPWATLAVNVIGSFLLGAIMQAGTTTALLSPTVRLALTTGVMGGFTTYSTFNYETLNLFSEGAWSAGFLNIGITVLACLAAGIGGVALARFLFGA
jgi:CrcB protein